MSVLDYLWPATRKVVAPTVEREHVGRLQQNVRDLLIPTLFQLSREDQADKTMDVDMIATVDGIVIFDRLSSRRELLFTVGELKSNSFKADYKSHMQRFMFKRPRWDWRSHSRCESARRNKPKRGKYKRAGATWLG